MAPSRDRLLHFGFKATVSARGRELGGQKGRTCRQGSWGRVVTRLGFGGCVWRWGAEGTRQGAEILWVGACLFVRGREARRHKRGSRALCCPARLVPPWSASTRALASQPALPPDPDPPTPPPHPAQTHTEPLPCLSVSRWARLPRGPEGRPCRRAPAAPGRSVRGCARHGGGVVPRRRRRRRALLLLPPAFRGQGGGAQ